VLVHKFFIIIFFFFREIYSFSKLVSFIAHFSQEQLLLLLTLFTLRRTSGSTTSLGYSHFVDDGWVGLFSLWRWRSVLLTTTPLDFNNDGWYC